MASINVDHEQLQAFSQSLYAGAESYNGIRDEINRNLINIENNEWNDNKYKEFIEIFRKSEKDINDIYQLMMDYSGYLNRKADKVRDYQTYNVNNY